ncbi:MAG: AAA family ATPase [Spirochaetota bacterium]
MYERMKRLLHSLSTDLHEREEAVRLGVLAAVAGESLFLLGPPGTGKSLIARRLQQAFRDAGSFSYLMGRFSTPDEVFGPLSIRSLREEDRYERNTASYLPDADVVFLDEVWKASPPIQNALLTALNERVYRNGTREVSIPMKVFIGASNELPVQADEAAAFWDRFLIRIVVDPIRGSEAFAAMLEDTDDPYREVVDPSLRITDSEYRELRSAENSVSVPPNVIDLIASIRAALAEPADEGAPIYVSDRRWKKITGLLRMSALLHGRDHVEAIDCAIIRSCVWSTLDELPRATAIVAHELAARSGRRQSAERLRARLEELRRSYTDLAARTVEGERMVPRVYRDEYFRLVARDDVHPQESKEQLLVWRGDYEDTARSGSGTIDLFVYDPDGQLVGSQQADVVLEADWRLTVDGRPYEIETDVRAVATQEQRTLDSGERASLMNEITALTTEIDQQIDELVDEQNRLEDAAQSHLFVPATDARIVLEAIRTAARELSETRLLALELGTTITG